MYSYKQLFDVDFVENSHIHEYFEFELVLQIFVLYENRVVGAIDFDIPRQKYEFAIVVRVKVQVEITSITNRVLCELFQLETHEIIVQLLPILLMVEQPQL